MTFIYFSPVAWDSYEQRPHYFVRDFLAQGGRAVTWINPYASRLLGWRDVWRADWRAAPLTLPRPAGLTVIDVRGLPIDPLPGGARLNERLFWRDLIGRLRALPEATTILGIGRPTALALAALDAMRVERSFYDAMDDFPEFYSGRSRASTQAIEREIARRVQRTFASSTHLARKFAEAGAPVTLLRNAYDMAILPPVDARSTATSHLGFIGCLGGWFDWDTVRRVAEAAAPTPVSLIGPRAVRVPDALPDNIQLHPPCSQAEGVRWLQSFTAGLIPFAKNALTAGVDPIKYYQYRGAGLPVLSTRFGEMATRSATDATFFLDDAGGAARAIAGASAHRPAPADTAAFRAAHTWEARFRDARPWPNC